MRSFKIMFLVTIFLLVLGCNNTTEQEVTPSDLREVKTISIGTIGSDAVELVELYQPVIDYVAQKLSTDEVKYEGKVIISRTADEAADALNENRLDLFIDSPLTAAFVADKTKAEFLLRRWKGGVGEYHSIFVVAENSSITNASDFVGKLIAFENKESTSGFALPFYYLLNEGFVLKEGSSSEAGQINYYLSEEDINTITHVIDGKADIGAFSNTFLDELDDETRSKVRVVGETLSVPRHIVVVRSGLDDDTTNKVRESLLLMDSDAEGKQILINFKKTTKFDAIPNREALVLELNNILTILDSE